MNRRSFFAKLAGAGAGAAAAVAAPVVTSGHETWTRERGMKMRREDFHPATLTLVHPFCPRCGDAMAFEGRPTYPTEPVVVHCYRCNSWSLCPTKVPVQYTARDAQWDAEAAAWYRLRDEADRAMLERYLNYWRDHQYELTRLQFRAAPFVDEKWVMPFVEAPK